MEPEAHTLRLYGQPSAEERLGWAWVDEQLRAAGTYWVVARSPGHPHPRPVWGVWLDGRLYLSVGSPVLHRQLAADPAVTVHLDSGVEPVIVEGRVAGSDGGPGPVGAYDRKYDYRYDVDQYGPLQVVQPDRILAWRSAGPAGRDGFRLTGRWSFPSP